MMGVNTREALDISEESGFEIYSKAWFSRIIEVYIADIRDSHKLK